MLKRSAAAAAGLTILAARVGAGHAARPARADTAAAGRDISLKEMIAEAKKEGQLNMIALPPDWANYGEIIDTFKKKYGISITDDNPNGSSAQENQAIVSLKGDPRAPDVVDVCPSFAVAGANEGLYAKYYVSTLQDDPARDEGRRGYWVGDYWGAISIGYNRNIVKHAAEVVRRPAQAGVQEPGRAERQPAHVGLGVRRRLRGVARERRLAQRHRPGHRLLREAEEDRATSSRCRRRRRPSRRARRRSRSTGTT